MLFFRNPSVIYTLITHDTEAYPRMPFAHLYKNKTGRHTLVSIVTSHFGISLFYHRGRYHRPKVGIIPLSLPLLHTEHRIFGMGGITYRSPWLKIPPTFLLRIILIGGRDFELRTPSSRRSNYVFPAHSSNLFYFVRDNNWPK